MMETGSLHREEGKDVLSRFSLHSVFMGIHKIETTVARIVARIYKAIDLSADIVEVDRQGWWQDMSGKLQSRLPR